MLDASEPGIQRGHWGVVGTSMILKRATPFWRRSRRWLGKMTMSFLHLPKILSLQATTTEKDVDLLLFLESLNRLINILLRYVRRFIKLISYPINVITPSKVLFSEYFLLALHLLLWFVAIWHERICTRHNWQSPAIANIQVSCPINLASRDGVETTWCNLASGDQIGLENLAALNEPVSELQLCILSHHTPTILEFLCGLLQPGFQPCLQFSPSPLILRFIIESYVCIEGESNQPLFSSNFCSFSHRPCSNLQLQQMQIDSWRALR